MLEERVSDVGGVVWISGEMTEGRVSDVTESDELSGERTLNVGRAGGVSERISEGRVSDVGETDGRSV